MGRKNIQRHVDQHLGTTLKGPPIRSTTPSPNNYNPFSTDVNQKFQDTQYESPPESYKTFGDDLESWGT